MCRRPEGATGRPGYPTGSQPRRTSSRSDECIFADARGFPGLAITEGRRLVIVHGMNDGLTAGEWEQLITLLERFAEHDLDQHDAWQLQTSHGPVFVRINRQPRPDEPAEAFRRLARPGQHFRRLAALRTCSTVAVSRYVCAESLTVT